MDEKEIESNFRKAVAGKPYRPPNGTEGMMFIDAYCSKCWHDRAMRADPDGCDGCSLIANSMAFNLGDPGYPKEWVYDDKGFPKCTAFRDETRGEPLDPSAAIGDLFAMNTPTEP